MRLTQRLVVGIAALPFCLLVLTAQEGGRGGGRNTREFLGLGPPPDPVAAKKGEPLYIANCAACHGKTARGGQAPDLVRSVVILHDDKDEIAALIKGGRPQAGMPAFPALSQDDIHNISQFLKMQVELAANRGTYGQTYSALRSQTSGDPRKGQEFFEAHCVACHSASGDLSKIGAKFPQAATLQARFIWPANPGPPHATVILKSGQTIAGTVLRLDDFDVALRDATGEYHYWARDQVQVQLEEKLSGHRALLPKYSDADLHNITAYLATLK